MVNVAPIDSEDQTEKRHVVPPLKIRPCICVKEILCYTCNTREVAMLAVRLPEDIERRLADLAAKTGRTKTFYAREAILEHLDEMEDRYLAIDRLEKRGKRWTLDELEQELDLAR